MSKASVTISLDSETVEFLDQLAVAEECDRSYTVRKAVTNFVHLCHGQIVEIAKAVKEAEAGLFLSDKDSAALLDDLAQ